MSKAKKPEAVEPGFTGVTFTTECFKQNGMFNNFKLLTIFIVNGEIVHIERSDPYATFEAIDIADVRMHRAILNLGSRYKHGATMGLGGEDRDSLLERLRNKNPEVLAKIAPALSLEIAK